MAETVAELTDAVNAGLSKLSPTDELPDSARFQLLDSLEWLLRVMRLLSSHCFFTETELYKYQPQPLALGFATGAPPSEVIKNL
ncbi:O-methyltransferase [Penicillium angulare]|uniref:O-methyltransferase n=1 Tax=Penicillium angulare TaxID=116970 RepID=UPI0025404D66|nr:O-methyltransferase [Penicillium angulare]KAJ5279538.1 O-methyltransferase [Penicillium angulare]